MAGSILFGKGDKENIKTMIEMMWNFRLGKKLQKENIKEENMEQTLTSNNKKAEAVT